MLTRAQHLAADAARLADSPHTILFGASARAAAFSTLRAGLKPWCLDLFADADLRAVAPVCKIPFADYPQCIPHLLEDAPAGPVMYTGGLENHPRLIDAIATKREILGNGSAVLRKVRDPFFVSRSLQRHQLCAAPVARSGRGNWLKKPLRGAGGSNISFANDATPSTRGFYFQQFIPGSSYAAAFHAHDERTELLGITEQLVGEAWLNAKPFQYCGSIGPIELTEVTDELIRLGEVLRTSCGLRGLFGVDFILNDGRPWLIEANPRYTASMEVLEHATGRAFLSRQARQEPPKGGTPTKAGSCWSPAFRRFSTIGKAILFAPSRLVVPDDVPWTIHTDPFTLPAVADVPNPGDVIEPGWPIMSVFARGSDPRECRTKLAKLASVHFEQFFGISQPILH